MKKKLLGFFIITMLVFAMGCGVSYQEATTSISEDYANGYFTEIVKWQDSSHNYRIVYANDTHVKYLIISSGYNYGITPLYNTDGSLQVYEEE